MKKLLVLFGVLVFVPAFSYAYIDESETSNMSTLKDQGFSLSTLEIVDTVKYHNSDKNHRYQRQFNKKDHRYFGKGYQYVKNYIDPIQDDGLFGEHQINYSNNWNGDNTRYSSELDSVSQIDNL